MTSRWSRVAAVAAPSLVAIAPKCPLCLLPLCAALGISVPSAPLMNVALALIAAIWILIVYRRGRAVIPSAGAAGLVVVGRIANLAALSWCGVAGMLILSLISFRGEI